MKTNLLYDYPARLWQAAQIRWNRRTFPLPTRNEWGEGQGEGLLDKTLLLSPALSSILWRRGSCFGCGFAALSLFVVAVCLQTASPLLAADAPKKLLVVTTTTGFRHTSIPTAEKIIAQLAEQSGAFTVEFVSQPEGKPNVPYNNPTAEQKVIEAKWEEEALKPLLAKLSPDSLKNYDGIIFANTTGDLPIPDKDGFLAWIKSGGVFIGIHSASDTFHGWPEFIEMIGGEFKTHGAQVGVECLCEDQAHPATSRLGKSWVILQEEIYQFTNYNAMKVHELLVLDKHPNNKTPGRFPVSWTRDFGKGKVFYTSLGHREDIWDTDPNIPNRKNPAETSKAYQAHILGGIKWALGLDASGAPVKKE